MNETIEKIITELQGKYSCHTIILYGSRARNEATETSDYDIVGIREDGESTLDCREFEDSYLDAFIYPESALEQLDPYFIRIKDGIVLIQKGSVGDDLIAAAKSIYAAGPVLTPKYEKRQIIAWRKKMFERSLGEDVESNFRLHWVLHDSLECYFKLRDLWYLGPKESFKWLQGNDFPAYQAFQEALEPNAGIQSIENLIKIVNRFGRD